MNVDTTSNQYTIWIVVALVIVIILVALYMYKQNKKQENMSGSAANGLIITGIVLGALIVVGLLVWLMVSSYNTMSSEPSVGYSY